MSPAAGGADRVLAGRGLERRCAAAAGRTTWPRLSSPARWIVHRDLDAWHHRSSRSRVLLTLLGLALLALCMCDGVLTGRVGLCRLQRARARIGHVSCVSGHTEEPVMRRLWYQDSYGHWHRDRQAERGAGGGASPMRVVVIVLIVLAGLMVLASLASHGSPGPHP